MLPPSLETASDIYEESALATFWVPPGHFYSPLPNLIDIRRREQHVFSPSTVELPGIHLRTEEQLKLLEEFSSYDRTELLKNLYDGSLRYYVEENKWFHLGDAMVLHCMMRHCKPKRLVEIGCGFSSAMILDTDELYLENNLQCTFVDPFPERLFTLLRPSDAHHQVLSTKLQDIDRNIFDDLQENDIVFFDSSHVLKTGSELNDVLFNILPNLPRGVYIHFHDIFHRFEYPKKWVYEGRGWNEIYALRAFLQYNTAFDITFFSSYLQNAYTDTFKNALPECNDLFCGSMWLRKR